MLDKDIFRWLHALSHISPWSDRVILYFSNGFGLTLITALLVYVFVREKKKDWFSTLWTIFFPAAIAFFLTQLIKRVYESPRPFYDDGLSEIFPLFVHGGVDSFPSGHATLYMAVAVSVFFYNKKIGYLFLIATLLITVSRVIAGVHWPSDILAGYVVGFLTVFVYRHVVNRQGKKRRAPTGS
jgi:undecaprenyl-diphosphatase